MGPGPVPFQAHLELLLLFLAHRDEIVEHIQGLLNAQRKPTGYLRDSALLARHFEECFFALAGARGIQWRLRSLEDAHWASGFRPREIPGLNNGPADPAEMLTRGFYMWTQTRWPGRGGRARYAHTLFNLYILRYLELLSVRLWDDASGSADDRLAHIQEVLDALWKIKASDQPPLVSDARWLIQIAQSLATDDLGAYFRVAQQIETLSRQNRLEIHKAGVRMAAGHLRSQTRYFCTKNGVSLDEKNLVLNTRSSNALDFALLIQELVPVLEAYEDAWHRNDGLKRLELAEVICQGLSPDPELFLNRVDLLSAYSMIEHLFITTEPDGRAIHTPMGWRHVRLVQEYTARIGRVSKALHDDCPRFRPVAGAYSPYGIIYGFSSDLLKHIVLKASQPDAENRFGLEDVFVAGNAGSEKLAWVTGWRKLPHLTREVEKLFDYPQRFAEEIFERMERALGRRVSNDQADTPVRTGRLFVLQSHHSQADSKVAAIPDLPGRLIQSSDEHLVDAYKAEPRDQTPLSSDRREGRFLVSVKTPGGWLAIDKAVLTEVLGAGLDARVAGLPPTAADALKLMYPDLVTVLGHDGV
jgi:hypothetical protein